MYFTISCLPNNSYSSCTFAMLKAVIALLQTFIPKLMFPKYCQYTSNHEREFSCFSSLTLGKGQESTFIWVDRDNAVGIATRYVLESPGIKFRWGREFAQSSKSDLKPTQPPVKWALGLFPGLKRSGRGVDYSPSTRAEVQERADLYISSPSGFSCLF